MHEGLIDDLQGGFREVSGCINQIFIPKQIGEKAREKKCRVHVGFMDLEKPYDRVHRKALWQVLRMYDVGGKLLNDIKSIYVNSLACVRIKGCESEPSRIDSGVREMCIMYPWLFNVYMDVVMKKLKMGMGKRREKIGDCLASCMQMIWFCVVNRRKTEGNSGTVY